MPSITSRFRRGILSVMALLVVQAAAMVPGLSLAADRPAPPRELSFEQRVAAQRAIEEVYWRHRIWPQENPGPKPSLSEVMPDDVIRAKVEDTLRKSNALEQWWKRPVTAAQLQAELDRMARDTRDPGMLRELQAVLGNDAFLIAETLGRSTLVDRLIRNWYAFDARFHGEVRQTAERALAGARSVAAMKELAGRYLEQTVARRTDDDTPRPTRPDGVRLELDAQEWTAWNAELARWFGTTTEKIPVGGLSPLQEDADRFFAIEVLSLEGTGTVMASVDWNKQPFDAWWAEARNLAATDVELARASFSLRDADADDCVDDTWVNRYHAPIPRAYHTAIWTGAEMIVWGGASTLSAGLKTGGRYNPSTDSWTTLSTATNAPSGRADHTAVWTGTEMILWGGDEGGNRYLGTGGRYDPWTDTWQGTSTGANVPTGRHFHTAVWTGTEMVVWGGEDVSGRYVNTGGRYNPSTDAWTATSPAGAPAGRLLHTSVWTDTEMVVWGGVSTGGVSLNTGGRYNPSTDTWAPTSVASNAPSARNNHVAVWAAPEMIVWGGQDLGSFLNTGGRYNASTDAWTPTSTGAGVPEGRNRFKAVWTGTEMIIWGGSTNVAFNTGSRYRPSADEWTPTSVGTGVPGVRRSHTAVWTGTEMIVWGGVGTLGNQYLDSGGRYEPATDSWIPTSGRMGLPSERHLHAAIWTGAEMIVWGGYHSVLGWLNTGGRFDRSTASWTPTSTGIAVPTARRNHTLVWSGIEMIVWGGDGPGLLVLNTGGRYRPSTDSWTATTFFNAPSARNFHTALWSGTEMIIWGGSNNAEDLLNGVPLNTGGRYAPSTNSWVVTSTGENVPSRRMSHSAVWTGTDMVVWGGWDGTYLNTGGRYNPATGSWATVSTGDNTPLRRSSHTAVWTGTEMIVWGGYLGGGFFPSAGGRYDPSLDLWSPISTGPSQPSARYWHSSAWTGREMIVWGGGAPDARNTGGRYAPPTDSWIQTSTGAGVPTARSNHTAIWTGTEMIVWGGFPFDGGDYGFYCAAACSAEQDLDGDYVGDSCDNCPAVANVDQADFDDDSAGDVCESGEELADANRSSRVDGFDLALLARAFGGCDGTGRYDRTVDLDRSGCVDGLDLAILAEYFGQPGA